MQHALIALVVMLTILFLVFLVARLMDHETMKRSSPCC